LCLERGDGRGELVDLGLVLSRCVPATVFEVDRKHSNMSAHSGATAIRIRSLNPISLRSAASCADWARAAARAVVRLPASFINRSVMYGMSALKSAVFMVISGTSILKSWRRISTVGKPTTIRTGRMTVTGMSK